MLLACIGLLVTFVIDPPVASAAQPVGGLSADGEDPPAPDACGARIAKKRGGYWECTFNDEFSGTELDRTKWLGAQTEISGIANGDVCTRDEPWTISVKGGMLRLTARKLLNPFLCKSPYGNFRTDRAAAAVSTRDRFSQAYGRFEVRAKMPDTTVQGLHSAIWLFPDQNLYGLWPLSGEIDIAEWYSGIPQYAYPSLHYADGLNDGVTGLTAYLRNASAFHTYAVEWSPDLMLFYYDGRLVYETRWRPILPLFGNQPFDKPFNMILTQAWGGAWNAPVAATPTKATMTIDWVRVWQ
ncbi:glycoside hydrolase family 16 protein [Nocardioides humilatus]|nr:glycoside hydrolase family 16 protein [Nocardioides humilatus]